MGVTARIPKYPLIRGKQSTTQLSGELLFTPEKEMPAILAIAPALLVDSIHQFPYPLHSRPKSLGSLRT